MQPEPKKPEVVYRRTPDPRSGAGSSSERWLGYAPALAPLIIGFLLLLVVILVLGYKSANKTTDVSLNARDSNIRYYTQLSRLLDIRLKAINLNNEARFRDAAVARHELTPPLDIRVDRARDELRAAQGLLTDPIANVNSDEWKKLKENLQAYMEVTRNQREYNQDGFERYKNLEASFEKVIPKAQENYENIDREMVFYQWQAKRTILLWTIAAVFVGALVAVGTIWQVQRHFSDMRRSVLETRRERTFATQLLEGMVSAVAAIDNEDRIRSANAAFFQIFPKASIGASVLEKLGADDAMKMLETVTSIRVNKATYHGRSLAKVDE